MLYFGVTSRSLCLRATLLLRFCLYDPQIGLGDGSNQRQLGRLPLLLTVVSLHFYP